MRYNKDSIPQILKELNISQDYVHINYKNMTSLGICFEFAFKPNLPFETKLQNLNCVMTYIYEFRVNIENYEEGTIPEMVKSDLKKIKEYLITNNSSKVICLIKSTDGEDSYFEMVI